MSIIKFNLAQLLREPMGARREYEFYEARLPLDEPLTLREVQGQAHFTRTATGVFANVHVTGVVRLVCVRSLDEFDYRVTFDFADQFHSIVDIFTGSTLPQPEEEDPFFLDELHMVDIGEAIRTYTLLELPLNPVSEAYRDQLVSYSVQSAGLDVEDSELAADAEESSLAARLAALKAWAERQNRRHTK